MINDLGNTAETNKEKHTVVTKRARIHETERLISFHWVEGATLYEEEESLFWDQIKKLGFQGWRIQ